MSTLKEHCPALLLLLGLPFLGYILSDAFRHEVDYLRFGPVPVTEVSNLECDRPDGRITARVHLAAPRRAVVGIGLYTELEGVWARVDDTEVDFTVESEEDDPRDDGVRLRAAGSDEAEFELQSPVTDRAREYKILVEWSSTRQAAVRTRGAWGARLTLAEFTC